MGKIKSMSKMGPSYATEQVYGTRFISDASCNLFKIVYISRGCFGKAHFINCLNKEVNMTNKALSIFNQLRPVSIGFDSIFDHFERMFDNEVGLTQQLTVNYPPYNIVKTGSYTYNIEVALAGYNKKDISVEYADGVLTIKSIKEEKSDDKKDGVIHKGIAKRYFSKSFTIADDVKIEDAELKDGLLKIYLMKIVPEGKKPKKITVK